MGENFQKISQLVKSSELSSQDQKLFLDILSKATEVDLMPLLELFKEDPSSISKIFQNYQAKRFVLLSKDQNLWEKIIVEEKKELKG